MMSKITQSSETENDDLDFSELKKFEDVACSRINKLLEQYPNGNKPYKAHKSTPPQIPHLFSLKGKPEKLNHNLIREIAFLCMYYLSGAPLRHMTAGSWMKTQGNLMIRRLMKMGDLELEDYYRTILANRGSSPISRMIVGTEWLSRHAIQVFGQDPGQKMATMIRESANTILRRKLRSEFQTRHNLPENIFRLLSKYGQGTKAERMWWSWRIAEEFGTRPPKPKNNDGGIDPDEARIRNMNRRLERKGKAPPPLSLPIVLP